MFPIALLAGLGVVLYLSCPKSYNGQIIANFTLDVYDFRAVRHNKHFIRIADGRDFVCTAGVAYSAVHNVDYTLYSAWHFPGREVIYKAIVG